MIFLLEYNPSKGTLIELRQFADGSRAEAEDARLAREVALLASDGSREVVLLEASNEDELRKTHQRYFKALGQLGAAAKASLVFGGSSTATKFP